MVKNFVQFSNDKKYEFAKIGTKIIKNCVVSVRTGLIGETDRSDRLPTTLSICLDPIKNKTNLSLSLTAPSPSLTHIHSLPLPPSRALPLPHELPLSLMP